MEQKDSLKELYLFAAEEVLKKYSTSELYDFINYDCPDKVPRIPNHEKNIFYEAINMYLCNKIGNGSQVRVYGFIKKKLDNKITVRINYMIDSDNEFKYWDSKIFSDCKVEELTVLLKNNKVIELEHLKLGDHVECAICVNKSLVEILIYKRPFSFDVNTIKKWNPLSTGDDDNLSNIKQEIQDKSDELYRLKQEIKEKENHILELNDEIERKDEVLSDLQKDKEMVIRNKAIEQKKLAKYQDDINRKNELLDSINEQIKQTKASKEYAMAEFVNEFFLEHGKQTTLLPEVKFLKFDTADEKFFDYMQGYMYYKDNDEFLYSKDILKNTFYALQTNQLIIYAGKPGSGKSQLVKHIAKIFGAAYFDVAVQSSWMDKSDLLGFYDPIHNNYVPTSFLENLQKMCKEASKNPNRLFIICLDELNLAHVEYYFADFLSRLQVQNDADRYIELYSESIYELLREEISLKTQEYADRKDIDEFKIDMLRGNIDINEYIKLKKMWKMIIDYPSHLIIPKNIKFFGTINTDATTKDLSPKVLDRAMILKLEKENISIPAEGEYEKCVDYFSLINDASGIGEEESKGVILTFKDLNVSISMRIQKQLAKICYANRHDLEDLLLSCIILPKISAISMDEANRLLDIYCERYSYARTVYGFIKNNCNQFKYYSFWR